MRWTNIFYPKFLIFSGLAISLASCGSAIFTPNRTHPARTGEPTALTSSLKNLPEPAEPLIVAVYQFRDQTGQYKPQDGGSGFSTAVTQGAANILIKVLQDSKWFSPIERENISDLLNERKIIRSTRQQFGMNEELPGLLYAGVLLEGGIVSYDANVVTSGVGLRYFGTGGGSQYRQDRVTVYLRAVSVSNGKILKTVYASKMILSQSVDGGMFRFVKFQRLLEAETGFTFNEPMEIAVTEAIEKAVETLVYEGIENDFWTMKEKGKKKEVLDEWHNRFEQEQKIDLLNQLVDDRRRIASFSIASANFLYKGDFAAPRLRAGFEAGFGYNLSPSAGLKLRIAAGQLATAGNRFSTNFSSANLDFQWRHTPFYRTTPTFNFGIGLIQPAVSGGRFGKANLGAGLEFLAKKKLGIAANFDYNYAFSDLLDDRAVGSYTDTFWQFNLGLNFYFGKNIKNSRRISGASDGKPKQKGPLQGF